MTQERTTQGQVGPNQVGQSRLDVDGFETVTLSPDTLGVRGTLGFATATQALQALRASLSSHASATTLDLSGITHADSAGLACLLTLLSEASASGRELRLASVPDGVQVLARVCGVGQLLDRREPSPASAPGSVPTAAGA